MPKYVVSYNGPATHYPLNVYLTGYSNGMPMIALDKHIYKYLPPDVKKLGETDEYTYVQPQPDDDTYLSSKYIDLENTKKMVII